MKIKRAIVSVSDKRGVVDLAGALREMDVEIISTGGTADKIKSAGIPVTLIHEVTGFPEMMDGRVKTLHPAVHGALLGRRDQPSHMKAMEEHKIEPIDMVVVNLYPFRETIAKENCQLEEAIENIDIGGPSMIRSAAKNFEAVAVVVDPSDYKDIVEEMRANERATTRETRYRLAAKAFRLTAGYDGAIATYLSSMSLEGAKAEFSPFFFQSLNLAYQTRYGENPHQQAAFYIDPMAPVASLARAERVQGPQVSFNNLLDMETALRLLLEFEETAACLVKHTNPCGVAISAESLVDAYKKAHDIDPDSAGNAVVGLNRKVDAETASAMMETYIDALLAPDFDKDALEILSKHPKLPLVKVDMSQVSHRGFDHETLTGGMLVQERDVARIDLRDSEIATKRHPDDDEYRALRLAWVCVKHLHTDAVAMARPDRLVAIGAGQTKRIDSIKIADIKAREDINGAVMASDGFLQKVDCVEEAARLGITAIVHPGGGENDPDIIAACDEHEIAMVLTGMRHFRH